MQVKTFFHLSHYLAQVAAWNQNQFVWQRYQFLDQRVLPFKTCTHLNIIVVHAVEEFLVEFLNAPVELFQLFLVFAPLPLVPLEKPVV